LITAFGGTRTLARFAREFDIQPDTVSCRLARGWSAEDALTRPLDRRGSPRANNDKPIRAPRRRPDNQPRATQSITA
jgi:hypothetical protein